MIEILPIKSADKQREYCEDLKVEYLSNCLLYAALKDGNPVAICQFEISSERARIRSCYGNKGTLLLTLRAVLNFICTCGTPLVEASSIQLDEKSMLELGFENIGDQRYQLKF